MTEADVRRAFELVERRERINHALSLMAGVGEIPAQICAGDKTIDLVGMIDVRGVLTIALRNKSLEITNALHILGVEG